MSSLLVMGAGLIGQRHIDTIRAHPLCTLAGVMDDWCMSLTAARYVCLSLTMLALQARAGV